MHPHGGFLHHRIPSPVRLLIPPPPHLETPMPNKKRGPKEDRLVIPGKWRDAVKKSLEKRPPANGWPDPSKGRKTKVAGTKRRAKP